jgi:hypothetical protein
MGFPQNVAEKALISCQRACSICHKFCGTKIELHHIKPSSEGGADTYENCIPLCFDCHADVRAYDPKHPKGKKYTESELKRHRDAWYAKIEKGEVNFKHGKNGEASDFPNSKKFKIIPKINTFRPHAFLGDGRVDTRTHFTVDFDFINNRDEITILYRPDIVSFKPNCDLLSNKPAAIQFRHFPGRIDFWTFPYRFEKSSRDLMRCEIDVNITNNNLAYFSKKIDSLDAYEIEFHFTHEDMNASKTIEKHKICGTYDDFKEEVRNFWKGKNIFQTDI